MTIHGAIICVSFPDTHTMLERNGTNLMLTIKGVVYPDEKVIIYDLGEAEESIIKPRGRKRKEP